MTNNEIYSQQYHLFGQTWTANHISIMTVWWEPLNEATFNFVLLLCSKLNGVLVPSFWRVNKEAFIVWSKSWFDLQPFTGTFFKQCSRVAVLDSHPGEATSNLCLKLNISKISVESSSFIDRLPVALASWLAYQARLCLTACCIPKSSRIAPEKAIVPCLPQLSTFSTFAPLRA